MIVDVCGAQQLVYPGRFDEPLEECWSRRNECRHGGETRYRWTDGHVAGLTHLGIPEGKNTQVRNDLNGSELRIFGHKVSERKFNTVGEMSVHFNSRTYF